MRPPHRAHPRLRGADASSNTHASSITGSSPLTRGGPGKRGVRGYVAGLIPAYAGRTEYARGADYQSRAHPRLRGADGDGCWLCVGWWGSSPLTRGGHHIAFHRVKPNGLIPAYAGRTTPASTRPSTIGAHPRLRGADHPGLYDSCGGLGSSPLTRGGRPHPLPRQTPQGLIPAYAGRTVRREIPVISARAHPRLRGADTY